MGPVVCADFEFSSKTSLFVGPVVCEDFVIFSKISFVWVLWCVGTLKIYKVPLCVGPVVCVDFEFKKKTPLCGTLWCVRTLKMFQKFSCVQALWCVETLNSFSVPHVCLILIWQHPYHQQIPAAAPQGGGRIKVHN